MSPNPVLDSSSNTRLESILPSCGLAVQPHIRCLVGLYGMPNAGDVDTMNKLLDQDRDVNEILQYALDHDDETDSVRFLIGSQSLKAQGSQITLITVSETLDIELKKRVFAHPDGEVVGLTALAAQPDWFVSVYSTSSIDRPELRTGARIWRIPSTVDDSLLDTDQMDRSTNPNPDPNSSVTPFNSLDYVTTLPLDKYSSIKKIASHPSSACADLVCVVGSLIDNSSVPNSSSLNSTTNNLVLLSAPSESGSGDYQIGSAAQLHLPSSSPKTLTRSTTTTTQSRLMASSNCLPISSTCNAIRWSPHERAGQLALAFDSGVLGWDIRSMKPCFWLEGAHWPCVRDLDYNPHRSNLLATGGDDGCLRLWDLRYLRTKHKASCTTSSRIGSLNASARIMQSSYDSVIEPLTVIQSHSHWVWSVRYHPTRDQLLLSSGSDCRVCLYNLSSYSSDALNDSRNQTSPTDQHDHSTSVDQPTTDQLSIDSMENEMDSSKDGLIGHLEQHEESVYATDWSPVDAWFFASVSYDGNFLVSRVPESVKLNILLQSKDY